MAIKQSRSGVKDPITGLNARQEAFCRYVTAGYPVAEAYESAGYDVGANGGRLLNSRAEGDDAALRPAATNLGNKLLRLPKIKDRLRALALEQQKNIDRMRAIAMERWAIDIDKTTKMLLEDRHFARTGELTLPDLDAEGNPVKRPPEAPPQDWRPDARAAVQATMGLAKLHGLLIDRKEVTVIDAMQNMNNNELIGFIAKLQAQLGPVIDVEVDSSPAEPSRLSKMMDADRAEAEAEDDGTGEAYE
jgi:hypothetical protein